MSIAQRVIGFLREEHSTYVMGQETRDDKGDRGATAAKKVVRIGRMWHRCIPFFVIHVL